MTSSGQSAWNPDDPVSEGVVYEKRLADDIGQEWKDLARALGFQHSSIEDIQQEKGNSKECCIEILVRWLRQNGKRATVGKLVDALTKKGLKNLAERFAIKPSDTNRFQNDKMEETIRDICEQLIRFLKENCKENSNARELEEKVFKMSNRIKELEEEVYKMSNRIKELEEEVSRLRAINKELQDGEKQEVEVSRLRAINKELQDGEKQEVEVSQIKELEEEVLRLKAINKELQDGEKQEMEVSKMRVTNNELQDGEKQEMEALKDELSIDMNACNVSEETDEEARERRISEKLQKYIRDLKTYVTSSLEVPEVKQDQLKTLVKLDLLITLSEHLEDLYIATREMVSETCKCSEDLKRDFYDFAYHGLRADHNELVHRVEDLEDTAQEMGEEEKEELQKLKRFQVNRQNLEKELEKKWRALFSPPERLPKTRWSYVTGRGKRSTDNKKVKRNTDPGARPKQKNFRDELTKPEAPLTSEEAPPIANVKRNTDRGARPKQRKVRDKRLQSPKYLSRARKTLKRLQVGTLHYQRLNES
ncbi:uncharacterized protein [Montipora capricornis]|uniref:uncharacterized protein isoform X2 n=1 Tax=Montipora capricornis TaxID=246305 RepID=UPI0035F20140